MSGKFWDYPKILSDKYWPIPLKNSLLKPLLWSRFCLGELPDPALPDFLFSNDVSLRSLGNFTQVIAISLISGGPVLKYLAMRLRFCAVAVSRNSS